MAVDTQVCSGLGSHVPLFVLSSTCRRLRELLASYPAVWRGVFRSQFGTAMETHVTAEWFEHSQTQITSSHARSSDGHGKGHFDVGGRDQGRDHNTLTWKDAYKEYYLLRQWSLGSRDGRKGRGKPKDNVPLGCVVRDGGTILAKMHAGDCTIVAGADAAGFSSGVHYWELRSRKAASDPRASFVAGVVADRRSPNTVFLGCEASGYGMGYGYQGSSGQVLATGREGRDYGLKFSAGDTVGVLLDLRGGSKNCGGSVSFFVNGVGQGVAFRYIPLGPRYRPAVGIYSAGVTVSVAHESATEVRRKREEAAAGVEEGGRVRVLHHDGVWYAGTVLRKVREEDEGRGGGGDRRGAGGEGESFGNGERGGGGGESGRGREESGLDEKKTEMESERTDERRQSGRGGEEEGTKLCDEEEGVKPVVEGQRAEGMSQLETRRQGGEEEEDGRRRRGQEEDEKEGRRRWEGVWEVMFDDGEMGRVRIGVAEPVEILSPPPPPPLSSDVPP